MCVGFSCDRSEKQHRCITSICWNQQEASRCCQVISLLLKSDWPIWNTIDKWAKLLKLFCFCFFLSDHPSPVVSDQHVKYMSWIRGALFQVCQVSASTLYRKMLSSRWDRLKWSRRSSCDTVSRHWSTLFLKFYFYKLFRRLLMPLFTSPVLSICNFYCDLSLWRVQWNSDPDNSWSDTNKIKQNQIK